MTIHQLDLQRGLIRVEELPDACPWCHSQIGLEEAYKGKTYRCPDVPGVIRADVIYECPSKACQKLFLAQYMHVELLAVHQSKSHPQYGKFYDLEDVFPQQPHQSKFDESINKLSNRFVVTFNEAEAAESYSLSNVAGPGYRKSFEILIKDFLISLKPSEEEAIIKEKKLAKLISDRIDHVLLKDSAARAAWLGNDEVHYARIWEDKDITDLKELIDIAVNFIAYELKAKAYIESMPKR